MDGPSRFWLSVRELTQSYDDAGLTTDERAKAILEQFKMCPAVARDDLARSLGRVMFILPVLHTRLKGAS